MQISTGHLALSRSSLVSQMQQRLNRYVDPSEQESYGHLVEDIASTRGWETVGDIKEGLESKADRHGTRSLLAHGVGAGLAVAALVASGPAGLALGLVSLAVNTLGFCEGLIADKDRHKAATVEGEAKRLYRDASESVAIHAGQNGALYIEDSFFSGQTRSL